MAKYKIWFEQVNAQFFEVTAKDEELALIKASALWKKEYAVPCPKYIHREDAKSGKKPNN